MDPGTRFSIYMASRTLLLCIYWNGLNSDYHNVGAAGGASVSEKIITVSSENVTLRLILSFDETRNSKPLLVHAT